MDRFSDLELFMLVVRRGNLTGAAQELGMTGAAVSKRLSALERRLGARLVQRTTRRLSVTAEGERYLAQGSAIVTALEELEEGLRGTVARATGLLRVNASLGFGRRCVAPALADFALAQPAVEVQLHLSDRPLNLVEHGFDVGIRVGDLADARTSARRLLVNRRVLCASPAYLQRHGTPARVGELARHQAIVLRENDETYGTWHLHHGGQVEVAKVRGSMNTNDGEVAVQWALSGFGLLLRSEWDIAEHLQAGRLRVVLPEWSVPADVHAVYPTRDQLSARTRAFIDFLVQRFAVAGAATQGTMADHGQGIATQEESIAYRAPAGDSGMRDRRSSDREREADREALARLVGELEAHNTVLRYSNAAAESASERFETLFSSVPLALMVIDEHDMVVQANAMAHRLFQPTEADRALISLMPFVSRGHIAKVEQGFREATRSGNSETSEVVFAIGDGGSLTGDLHIRRIETLQEDGVPAMQFICAVVDQGPLLAERRALQQSAMALQERNEQLYLGERRLEAVINSALDAIICVDQHQRITVFNPTAAGLFQCSAADALGSPLERFLPDAAQALAFAQISTQAMLGERTARTAAGRELSVEISVSFERHSAGETTTVFARDLTGRKKMEAHRAVLEAQLRESQKMQAMGTLAGGIAHDFNNILSAILGNVELAKGDLAEGSGALVSLDEIGKAGRRARDLVRQILTFSRNEPTVQAPVALAEVVSETERLLRVTLPPAIELRIQMQDGLPPVMADATQVEQALLNLCTNAIQAIGEARGSVIVDLASAHPDQRTCERLGIAPGSYATLSVRDSGMGMDTATIERIFEPFFTTKVVGQGTGLGLAVVHGVMRTHQGATDVSSVPGQGSTFTLYFPAAVDAANVPSGKSERRYAQTVAGAGHHVMYVDDDRALVFLVERLLRRRGFRVTGFSDPREAEQALREDPQAWDLLVTDYNMPGYSGLDLVRQARAIRADLPVALASGYVTTEIEAAARAEGARALIHKPNDVEELCATVQRLVMGEA